MSDEQTQPAQPEGDAPAQPAQPDVNAIVNAAVSSHLKRALGGLDKIVSESVTKVLASRESAAPAAPSTQTDTPKADPSIVKLREEHDALKRMLEEERRVRREAEDRSRTERTDATLRDALRAKGVRPELLDGAFYALRSTALRFNEDGTPRLAIKRSRERGREAEEVEFAIEDGVSDWLKSDTAKAYLPPPVAPPKPAGPAAVARPLGADGKPRALSREEAIDLALAQAASKT